MYIRVEVCAECELRVTVCEVRMGCSYEQPSRCHCFRSKQTTAIWHQMKTQHLAAGNGKPGDQARRPSDVGQETITCNILDR